MSACFRDLLSQALALGALLAGTTSCQLLSSEEEYRLISAQSHEALSVAQLARQLGDADVVFLGELHLNDGAHRFQEDLFEELHDLRGVAALSMEMFERDVQGVVDAYVGGGIPEGQFLEGSRPWRNYEQHYRPLVEFARQEGVVVLAANLPQELSSRIAKESLSSVDGEAWMPVSVNVSQDRYWDLFEAAMHGHGGGAEQNLENFFHAQCAKDDAMAESIHEFLRNSGAEAPVVLHCCGRFHSDFGLGTVSRLRSRDPSLKLVVISTVLEGEWDDDDFETGVTRADYYCVVAAGT